MTDRISKAGLAGSALRGVAESVLVVAAVWGLIFGLKQLADYRASRPITASADGRLVLAAPKATLEGGLELVPRALEEKKSDFAYDFGLALAQERRSRTVSHWSSPSDSASWRFRTPAAGQFDVQLEYAASPKDVAPEFQVTVDDQKLIATVPATGSDATYRTQPAGRVQVSQPGTHTLSVRAGKLPEGAVVRLKSVVLTRLP